MVVDVKSGRQLAAVNATNERHTPGSILKPLFLAAALEQRAKCCPRPRVFCRRNLHISDEKAGNGTWLVRIRRVTVCLSLPKRRLPTHANRYFAELADRIPPAQASAILAQTL